MNRTIKFRMWNVLTQTMFFPEGLKVKHGTLKYEDEYWKLMQWTGLKDKNGVEIYEGDILAGLGKKYAMEWSIYGWGLKKGGRVYTMDVGNILQNEWDADRKLTNFEVIGNIYEKRGVLEVIT